MRKILTTILLAAMAVSGCRQAATSGNQMAAAPKAEPAAKPASPAAAPPPASDCAAPPKLALAADFTDPRKAFAPGTPAFRRTAGNFSAAYRKACASGELRGHPLIEQGAAQPDTLFLKNSPDANDAAIYRDGGEDAPPERRMMVLEYPFVPSDGTARVPTADVIGEAIFCAVQGATAKDEEENGRCLVD